MISFT